MRGRSDAAHTRHSPMVWELSAVLFGLGPSDLPRAHLRFDRITQPWLRELAKRWTRLRLTSGLSIGATRSGVDALICFSAFLTLAGIDALADVDRPLLERYLAHVTSQPGGHGMKKTRIGGLNLFFQNIRQHGWDDSLRGTAAFYLGDIPPAPELVGRSLAEYVMAQIEAPANLDRWPDPAGRLVTLILIRCGLRISSALALAFDCLLHDGQGAPYLRYFNTKMRREAAVPIDEEIEGAIRDQQRRVLDQRPDGTTCLFPRPRANVSGNLLLADGTYRRMMARWLATCEVHDEHGRPVHLTPHPAGTVRPESSRRVRCVDAMADLAGGGNLASAGAAVSTSFSVAAATPDPSRHRRPFRSRGT